MKRLIGSRHNAIRNEWNLWKSEFGVLMVTPNQTCATSDAHSNACDLLLLRILLHHSKQATFTRRVDAIALDSPPLLPHQCNAFMHDCFCARLSTLARRKGHLRQIVFACLYLRDYAYIPADGVNNA